jgi:hypothetical protein
MAVEGGPPRLPDELRATEHCLRRAAERGLTEELEEILRAGLWRRAKLYRLFAGYILYFDGRFGRGLRGLAMVVGLSDGKVATIYRGKSVPRNYALIHDYYDQ